jgi:hypothetical protein
MRLALSGGRLPLSSQLNVGSVGDCPISLQSLVYQYVFESYPVASSTGKIAWSGLYVVPSCI